MVILAISTRDVDLPHFVPFSPGLIHFYSRRAHSPTLTVWSDTVHMHSRLEMRRKIVMQCVKTSFLREMMLLNKKNVLLDPESRIWLHHVRVSKAALSFQINRT